MKFLILLSGILLSSIGAFMSIHGLSEIFSGAGLAIIVMGIILELSKTVSAVYLKLEWSNIRTTVKSYFILSVVVLSVVTSLGVFGFLSKSYSTENIVVNSNTVEVESTQRLIDLEKERLLGLEKQRTSYGDKIVPRRITNEISQTIDKISELENKLSETSVESKTLQADLVPLVFISNVLFGSNDPDVAVKLLIVLLVITMDPLALLLTTVGMSMFRKRTVKMSEQLIVEDDVYDIDELLQKRYNE